MGLDLKSMPDIGNEDRYAGEYRSRTGEILSGNKDLSNGVEKVNQEKNQFKDSIHSQVSKELGNQKIEGVSDNQYESIGTVEGMYGKPENKYVGIEKDKLIEILLGSSEMSEEVTNILSQSNGSVNYITLGHVEGTGKNRKSLLNINYMGKNQNDGPFEVKSKKISVFS